jgi:hypothetical protein
VIREAVEILETQIVRRRVGTAIRTVFVKCRRESTAAVDQILVTAPSAITNSDAETRVDVTRPPKISPDNCMTRLNSSVPKTNRSIDSNAERFSAKTSKHKATRRTKANTPTVDQLNKCATKYTAERDQKIRENFREAL